MTKTITYTARASVPYTDRDGVLKHKGYDCGVAFLRPDGSIAVKLDMTPNDPNATIYLNPPRDKSGAPEGASEQSEPSGS